MTSRSLVFVWRSWFLRAAALLVLVRGSCLAQSVAVPVETHFPLLMKVIEYDRAFKGKINKVVKIGVVYQKSWQPSKEVFDDLLLVTGRGSFNVCGFPVQVVPIDVSGEANGAELMGKSSFDVVYLAPLRGIALEDIINASEAQHSRTITGVPRYVEDGIAIGIDLRNDRPLIIINLTAARACGADLSADVLRLARVVE